MLDVSKMVDTVLSALERPLSALASRIKALEDRPSPRDGKDADITAVITQVQAELESDLRKIKAIAQGAPVESVVKDWIALAIADLPEPKNGEPGQSITVDDVRPLIDEAVAKAVAAIPAPKDGEPGKDGTGVAGAIIDRDGNLVITLADGKAVPLGRAVGKDGEHGKPGLDGLGFDDLDLVETDEGLMLRFMRGDVVKSFRLPVVRDCGVFSEGSTYRKGDGVTWAGSFWICQKETSEKPGTSDAWRLSVKKGRDGKDKAA